MTLKEMREKQRKLVEEARQVLADIDGEDVDEARAKELEERYDAIMAEHDALEEKAVRLERLNEAEARQREITADNRSGTDNRGQDDVEGADPDPQESFQRAMQFGISALAPEARAVIANMRSDLPEEIRAQGIATGAAGGFTVPEGFLPEIEVAMAMHGPMLDPGVTRVITTDSGNKLPWPTNDDTGNKGAILAENTQVGEEDVVFGQKELDAFVYTSKLVRVSLQLLQDSAFSMDDLLNTLFGERIGRAANEHLTVGTGTGQPMGLMTASGAGHTASAAAAVSFDDLIELEHSVDPAYRRAPTCRYMFNDTTLKLLRKIKDANGNYIWQPANVQTGAPAQINDRPYTINQDVADVGASARSVAFGDFDKYIVRRVRDFTMLRLAERYADYLQVGFFAFNRIDGELSNAAAIKHLAHPAS